MSLISKIFGSEDKNQLDNETIADAGACPNCWGKQAYNDKFYEYVKDQTKSNVNNEKSHKKAFVQQFVESHVTGIKLKVEGEYQHCPMCKAKFKR